MKRELIPYYVSRAILSAGMGSLLVAGGMHWATGSVIGLVMFAGFIWYAHSGNYLVDTSNPLFPLRRDERGSAIRDRAVVLAVAVGGVAYALLNLIGVFYPVVGNLGMLALLAGIVTYFAASNWLFFAQR